MVSVLQIRIIGTAMLVLGLLILLYGVLTWDKKAFATGFIGIIIAITLLYYTRRMGDRPK